MIWFTLLARAEPLGLDEVLTTVDARVPELAAAAATAEEAAEKLRATRGAFDPVLRGGASRYEGKDPRTVTEASAAVRTTVGPELEIGWRRGTGDFPAYAAYDETSAAGEWWVGLNVPLLDGLFVNEERLALRAAGLEADAAALTAVGRRIEVRRRAAEAWVKWVAAGAERELDLELLDLAEQRLVALDRQVAEGARPRIDQIDSQRVVAERRSELVAAEADLQAAAFGLSLWYRTPEGVPIVPAASEVPPLDRAALPELPVEPDAAATPELRALDLAIEVARAELRRTGNGLLPKLDVYAVASHDPLAYDEIQIGTKAEFSPWMRKERGTRAAAAARLARRDAERAAALDRRRAELASGRIAIEAAEQRLALAWEARAAADDVLALEQRRLALGGGDLFQLLLRESTAATARRATVSAWAERSLAVTRYEALGASAE